MVFYKGSHRHSLDAKSGRIGLLEVPPESLDTTDIKPTEVSMKDGGWAIVDGRLGFKILQGITITVAFAAEEELKEWGKMKLPKIPTLMQRVTEMESEKIRMNFEFVELGSDVGKWHSGQSAAYA